MSKASPVFSSFNGGELSPRLFGRVDQAIYQISTAEMLNFVPTVEGPAMKRSGFRHVRAAAPTAAWLSPFIFSDTQAYVLEWSDLALRFYTNGGRIETDPATPYEVAVPFTAAEAPLVSTQQSYDRLYCAHRAHKPGALTRTAAATFDYAELAFKNGPFATRNSDESLVLVTTGRTGTVNVQTYGGGSVFLPEHVGGYVMIEAIELAVQAWEPQVRVDGGQLAVGDLRQSDGKVYECVAIAGVRTGTIQPTHTRGEEWDGSGQSILGYDTQTAGVRWKYLYDRIGVGLITAYLSGSVVTVDTVRPFPDTLNISGAATPSYRFSLPAWNAVDGWPSHVILAFDRLIFFTDFWLFASVVGDYGGGTVDMAPFSDSGLTAPDQAFSLRLAISNPILWARYDRDVILVGTADGVYAIRKINSSAIFSSDNVECVKQYHAGASSVPPVQTGSSTIFVQAGGRKLREAGYALDSDRYVSPNLNVWQRHILKGGCVQLAFQAEPDELLWAVRGDGQLALHPHVPEQEVRGFARIAHGAGPVLSATTIPGGDGQEQLWALVSGAAARSVELQDPPWEEGETALEDGFFVDSGATYSGAPTTTVTGLDHLEGQGVAVLADGIVVPGLTVTGGEIALEIAASKVQAGLPYSARLTTLRPELRDSAGNSTQGKRKRIVRVVLRVLETLGVKVDPGTGTAEALIDRPTSAAMDRQVPLLTGDTTDHPVGGSWDRSGQFTVLSDDPLPCMVVAAMPRLELSET